VVYLVYTCDMSPELQNQITYIRESTGSQKKPFGVLILGILAIFFGVFLFVMALNSYDGGLMSLILFSLSIAFFSSGIFLLKLKNWARVLLMISVPIPSLLLALLVVMWRIGEATSFSEPVYFVGIIGSMLFGIIPSLIPVFLVIFYLTRPSVKQLFI